MLSVGSSGLVSTPPHSDESFWQVGVAVGAVDPDDGCVDERRVDNEVTAREFDEDSEPVRLF